MDTKLLSSMIRAYLREMDRLEVEYRNCLKSLTSEVEYLGQRPISNHAGHNLGNRANELTRVSQAYESAKQALANLNELRDELDKA